MIRRKRIILYNIPSVLQEKINEATREINEATREN